jgi:UDP-glucose 4-epimerase
LEQRVLITGASGYVGQHLIKALSQANIPVRGFARSLRPANLSGVEWRQGDVRHLAEVQQAMQGCTSVVHLACLPLGLSFQEPEADFQVNALGTLNILQAAQATEVKRIVYTSTAQVYGFTEHLPITEDAPTQPTSPYAASKLCGEILCSTFARCYGLDTIILRLFNVYGPALDNRERSTVETLFLQRVRQGLPPIIKGNPDQGRDFIHVNDVVRAIRLALNKSNAGIVVNIGTGVMTTLLELARLAIKLVGTNLTPIIEETDTPFLSLQADTHKAKEILRFNAAISLSVGLADVLKLAESH